MNSERTTPVIVLHQIAVTNSIAGIYNFGVTAAAPGGDGFLANQGFTLVWAGWQADPVYHQGQSGDHVGSDCQNRAVATGLIDRFRDRDGRIFNVAVRIARGQSDVSNDGIKSGSLGSSSPYATPLNRPYRPTVPKLVDP